MFLFYSLSHLLQFPLRLLTFGCFSNPQTHLLAHPSSLDSTVNFLVLEKYMQLYEELYDVPKEELIAGSFPTPVVA